MINADQNSIEDVKVHQSTVPPGIIVVAYTSDRQSHYSTLPR